MNPRNSKAKEKPNSEKRKRIPENAFSNLAVKTDKESVKLYANSVKNKVRKYPKRTLLVATQKIVYSLYNEFEGKIDASTLSDVSQKCHLSDQSLKIIFRIAYGKATQTKGVRSINAYFAKTALELYIGVKYELNNGITKGQQ
jgi:hypothetical protein